MQFVQFCTLWITQTKTPKRLAALIQPSVVGRTSGMSKRGYHHGNLKQALIDAALTLIETKGPTGFTLSEASKTAGVTPAAVYRHFDGREDLIAEAARQGYGMFADLMEYAYQSGPLSHGCVYGHWACLFSILAEIPRALHRNV
jgi:AcrR family transcriptional regulator